MGHVMMPRTHIGAFALQTFFQLISLWPPVRDYFAEMRFKPKPRFHEGFLLERESGLVGRLFPQALVATASGYQLLDDLLGSDFALLAPPGTPPQLLEEVFASPHDIPAVRYVAVLDREDAMQAKDFVISARDVRGDLAKLLDGHPAGLFVLRPDRYVCAFFPVSKVETLASAFTRLGHATWRRAPVTMHQEQRA